MAADVVILGGGNAGMGVTGPVRASSGLAGASGHAMEADPWHTGRQHEQAQVT